MKKSVAALFIVLFIGAVFLSFLAGSRTAQRTQAEAQHQRCIRYITSAIDTAENKGLTTEGALEFIASNLWVAHELCDDPEISAQLSDLWNTLVYDESAFTGQEDALTRQLQDILEACS